MAIDSDISKTLAKDLKKMPSDPGGDGLETAFAHVSNDAERLEQLGHHQELDRQFSPWSLGALCLCLMATWEALSTVVATALVNGGAPCLFWNYLVCFLCTVAIACSMGEIASAFPTSGGQYYWVAALSPARHRKVAAWVTGWISVGSQILLTASAAFAAGLQTQSLIILNDSSYVPQRWQGMLFYWAVLLYAAAVNVLGAKILPHTNLLAGIIHVAAFVAILITLGVVAPKNTSEFVFTEFTNNSGWENDGVSWLVGLISVVYPMLGYDAACHLSEEIPHASRNVPLVMVGSVVINGFMGLVYCIILLYSTGALENLLSTPTGFPFMQIYLDATKSNAGATVMSLMLILVATAATVAGLTSTSRTLWAFARDKAIPYNDYFCKVDKKSHIPERAVVIVLVLQMLLGFLYIGNTTAFNAVLSMAIISLYLAYLLPIIYMLLYGRRQMTLADYGPWKLGRRLGVALNIISIIWMVVVMIFSTFPSTMPVTPQSMNYSIVVLAGWLVFGGIYYAFWGRKKFEVPVVNALVVTSVSIPMD